MSFKAEVRQEAAVLDATSEDRDENIIDNPKSWIAWKRQADSWRRVAERLEAEKQATLIPAKPAVEVVEALLAKLWFVASKLEPAAREDIASIIVALKAALSIPAGDGVPTGMVLVPRELIERFPEINPANYDASDAITLYNWGTEVVLTSRALSTTSNKAVNNKYMGKCKGGPYDGELHAYFAKIMPVSILDGMFIREGRYEFFSGIWLYSGAKVDSARRALSQNEGGRK